VILNAGEDMLRAAAEKEKRGRQSPFLFSKKVEEIDSLSPAGLYVTTPVELLSCPQGLQPDSCSVKTAINRKRLPVNITGRIAAEKCDSVSYLINSAIAI
jgi:hypothetical protein